MILVRFRTNSIILKKIIGHVTYTAVQQHPEWMLLKARGSFRAGSTHHRVHLDLFVLFKEQRVFFFVFYRFR